MPKILLIILLLIPALAEAENKTKIGVILPLTGEAASYGDQFRMGIELNAAKSGFEIIFEDSKFDPKSALDAFYKLSAVDKISYLISFGGSTCEVLNAQSQQKQLIHIAAGCNTVRFENKDSVNFRLDVNEAIAAKKTAEYLKKIGLTKIALLYINNSWGGTIIDHTKRAIKQAGLTITEDVAFESNQAGNLRSDLLKIRASQPDALFLISLPNLTPLILNQIHQNKISIPIMSNISVENPEVVRLAGSNAEGIFYLSVKDNPQTREMYPNFYANFPAGNPFAAWGYDSISLLAAAISSQSPKEYLHHLRNFIGAFNAYSFDPYGELDLPYEIKEIKNGKYIRKSDL